MPASETKDPKSVAKDFLDALKDLGSQLDAGEIPDGDLLDRLRDDADALGTELNAAQQPAGIVQSLAAAAGFATAILAPGLLPVVAGATTLVEAATGTQAAAPSADISVLADKLKALADKLATADEALSSKLNALADQLGSGKLSQAALDRLGLGTPEGELDQSLQALIAPKPAPTKTDTATPADIELPAPQLAASTSAGKAPDPPALAPANIDKAAAPAAPKPDHQPSAKAGALDGPAPAKEAAQVADTAPKAAADAPPAPPPTAPGVQAAQGAAAPKLLPAAYQTPQVNLPQLAFEIARQFHQGSSRFDIRLDPPELGRIDVRMHVDAAGNLNARLTVERSETLDMFQRDQRGLERALQQAGLDGAKTNLEFSLRQGPFERPTGGTAPQFSAGSPILAEPEPAQPSITLYRGTASAGGVNIFV